MKPIHLMMIGAAALLLMPRAQATTRTVVSGAPRQDYTPGTIAAANAAARVVAALWPGVSFNTNPAAKANPAAVEDARNAVRAGDPYYGSTGEIAWYAGNAEAARAAVREGDSYYTDPASAWAY